MTTNPKNPNAKGFDCGQRGWKVHVVLAHPGERSSTIDTRRALCGLLPPHGWGMDLHIFAPCSRCEAAAAKMGLALPVPGATP